MSSLALALALALALGLGLGLGLALALAKAKAKALALALTMHRYAALLRFKPSAPRASKACGVRFRRLKVLSSTARYLLAYVERHNLTTSLGWCAAVLHNHSRHPEQKGST